MVVPRAWPCHRKPSIKCVSPLSSEGVRGKEGGRRQGHLGERLLKTTHVDQGPGEGDEVGR